MIEPIESVAEIYDSAAAWWRWAAIPDAILGVTRLRRLHFSQAAGHVLDVGCGTGENFRHLERAGRVTGFDLSPEMARRALDRSHGLTLDVDVVVGDASTLPFGDASFDTVISAMSTCTFTDYVGAFREMQRVARPGGSVLLLEHGRSSFGWISRRQDSTVERHLERSACRNNRDPVAELLEAGMEISGHIRSHLGILHRFEISIPREA